MRVTHVLIYALVIASSSAATIAATAGLMYWRYDAEVASYYSPVGMSIESLVEDVIIESVDTERRIIYAQMYFKTRRDFIPTRLTMAEDFMAWRQDAVSVNNVVVGATPVSPLTIKDISPGMHGVAALTLKEDGSYYINRLFIGDPFPRP